MGSKSLLNPATLICTPLTVRCGHQGNFKVVMAGGVSDAILLYLSKNIDAAVYPINEFAIDLGFDTAVATAAEQMSIQSQDPTRKYKIILDRFVLENGRNAQNLIDVFEDKKKLLVDILKEAIEKERVQKQNQFRRIQAPRAVEDPGPSGTKNRPRHVTLQEPQQRPISSSRDQSNPSPSNQISQNRLEGNPKSTENMANFDDILTLVAKKVRKNSEIETLGKQLGFTPEDIEGYIATNHKTHAITCDGTLQMLRDWRKEQKIATEREGLKNALEKSRQINLADQIFTLTIAKENVQKPSKPEHYQEPREAERREHTEIEDCSPDFSLLVPQQRTEASHQNNPPPRPVPSPSNPISQNTLYWKRVVGKNLS
nr:uncharacterized protein LOC129272729 [Lytechinus pictus]